MVRLLGLWTNDAIDYGGFSSCFTEKIDKVHRITQDAPPLVFTEVKLDTTLSLFELLTVDDVITAVQRLPDKPSTADPFPTPILKQIIDVIAPYIVKLFNLSLSLGQFLAVYNGGSSPLPHQEAGARH